MRRWDIGRWRGGNNSTYQLLLARPVRFGAILILFRLPWPQPIIYMRGKRESGRKEERERESEALHVSGEHKEGGGLMDKIKDMIKEKLHYEEEGGGLVEKIKEKIYQLGNGEEEKEEGGGLKERIKEMIKETFHELI
ncbi:unnamed protein product [Spirodela intermedia]|uniref:Uncharacterized protein n=1 Tax=Spirodela intermedia TaxID=51605 RepID=A0A7I8JWG7_SPIIN|nr:unnamed protein product [Spirodela intermedia]